MDDRGRNSCERKNEGKWGEMDFKTTKMKCKENGKCDVIMRTDHLTLSIGGFMDVKASRLKGKFEVG